MCSDEAEVVEGGELHDEVVGVLAVDDGFAVGGLALLEELGVVAAGDGGGFEGEHGAEGELACAGPSWCWAMGMIQLVEKSLSAPRDEPACCWMSVRKALPWSMRDQPRVVAHKHVHGG